MGGKTIGKSFNFGFAGSYARQPDMIIQTRPNNDDTTITFGRAVAYDDVGGVINITTGFKEADFAGIASRTVKSALFFADQNSGGQYKWGSEIDANGVAELVLLTRANA